MKFEKSVLWIFLIFAKFSSLLCFSVHPIINHNWTRSEKMDSNGILQLQWSLRDKEIVFKVTVNSRGFIAIGFLYQNPKFSGFDMALAWIHDRTGKANILVGFSSSSTATTTLDVYQVYTKYFFLSNTVDTFIKDSTETGIMKNAFFENINFWISVLQSFSSSCAHTKITLKLFSCHGERKKERQKKSETEGKHKTAMISLFGSWTFVSSKSLWIHSKVSVIWLIL